MCPCLNEVSIGHLHVHHPCADSVLKEKQCKIEIIALALVPDFVTQLLCTGKLLNFSVSLSYPKNGNDKTYLINYFDIK